MSGAQLQSEGDVRLILGAVLVLAVGGGTIVGGLGLGLVLVVGIVWAFWAGGWVWSDASFGPLDDAARAGLVALYPAAAAGAFAAESRTFARLAEQPFVVAPPWLAFGCTAGGLLALAVVLIRARGAAPPAEPEVLSPAGPCAVVVLLTIAVVSLCQWIHIGSNLLVGLTLGLAVSFPVALLQGLTRRLLRDRLDRRRLTAALVLPWLLLGAALLIKTIHANHPNTIFRDYLGEPTPSVRALNVEQLRRGMFNNHIEISFRADPADLPKLAAQGGLRREPVIAGGDLVALYVDYENGAMRRLSLDRDGRVRFSWSTRLGFP